MESDFPHIRGEITSKDWFCERGFGLDYLYDVPQGVMLPCAIHLCNVIGCSCHQEVKSIRTPLLESGLASWLVLINRMQQKWCHEASETEALRSFLFHSFPSLLPVNSLANFLFLPRRKITKTQWQKSLPCFRGTKRIQPQLNCQVDVTSWVPSNWSTRTPTASQDLVLRH